METRSFIIFASNKSNVEAQLEKLNKRATKLGLDNVTCSWGKAYLEQDHLMIPVSVIGPLDVSFNGWKFIATLQHLPTGENIIRSISDEFEVPKQFRTAGSDCQHCNSKRYRKDTYLVRDTTTGVILQVGSTCIKDFLGGNSPDNILNRASFIAELVSYMEGCSGGGSGERVYHIESFLAMTSACIRDHGWVSKKTAYENDSMSTAAWVANNFDPPIGFKDGSTITEDDMALAASATEWVENISDEECESSDYLFNIRAIARSGMVGYRTFGFAASIIPAYNRNLEAKSVKNVSRHVGTIKKREVFDLTLNRHFSYDSMYGTLHKYIFSDEDGNKLVWSTSTAHSMVEGKRYRVNGTVKDHTEYKGTPNTILARCKILSE